MRRITNSFLQFLKSNNITIAFAESVTCGLLAHQLNTVKGTSEALKGSIVCYDEEVKVNLMRVQKSTIKKFTAESQQVTDELAKKLKNLIHADIHAAITGLAAPGASESKTKPVGTIFFAFVFRNKVYSQKKYFRGNPLIIKKKSCEEFYRFIFSNLKKTLKNN